MKLTSSGSNVWSETWVDQPGVNVSQTIAVDSFSNVYAAGFETYFPNPKSPYANIGLLKYDQYGNQLWHNGSVEGTGSSGNGVVGLLLNDSDDVFIEFNLAVGIDGGYTTSKVNPDGSTAWTDYDPTDDGNSAAFGMVLDSKGDTIITGKDSYPPVSSYGTYKIGTNGSYVWTNLYPTLSNSGSAALALAVDFADNIYVTGESSVMNAPYEIATLKLDSNGNQLWVQRYITAAARGNAGNAIAVDNSGNVYVAGCMKPRPTALLR